MGIEPTRAVLPELKNKRFGAMANPKCDWRVNFRGMWGNVGIHRSAKAPSSSLSVWCLNGPISDGGSERFFAIKCSLAHSLQYVFFNLGGAPSPVPQYPKWPWPLRVLSIRLSDPPAAK